MTHRPGLSEEERHRSEEVDRLFQAGQVQALIDRLIEPSWAVRRMVAAALARLGDSAVPLLCGVLQRHRDDEGRLAAAVDALVASTGEVDSAASSLAASENPAVACDAAQILGRRRSATSVPTLARLVDHEDDNVALAAIEALGRIGNQEAVDLLLRAVDSRNFFRVFPAIDVLGRTGDPRAVGPLCALLATPHYAIEAARALGRTGQPAAATALAALLTKPSDTQVRVAASALVEIHDRHAARFGPHRAVTDVLATIDGRAATRRLGQALVGADPGERAALSRVLGWVGGAASLQALLDLLDSEPAVVQAVANSIAGLGREAEPSLLAALRDSPAERRLSLLPLLARRRVPIQAVLACLEDPDARVRASACETLGKIGDVDAVQQLFDRLLDADARVAQCAVAAIQSLGGAHTERLALRASAESDPRLRRSALRILGYFGWPSALDAFLTAVRDPDERIREVAVLGLSAIDEAPAISALLAVADHPSARTRGAAVKALGQTRGDAAVRERLRAALRDPDPWVRYYACQALSRLNDDDAADAIRALSHDPAGHVRVAAVEALARLRGDSALDALHAAAASTDPDLQRAALLAVASVKNPASFELVRSAARSDDPATRLVAVSAIAEFDIRGVEAVLGDAAGDADDSVRSAAVALLGSRPGAAATETLVGCLSDPSLRERVVAALSHPLEGRIETLLSALRAASTETAPLLVSALVRMRRAESTAALERAFGVEGPVVRKAVAPALAALQTSSARSLLEGAAEHDPDAQVREVCAAVLGR